MTQEKEIKLFLKIPKKKFLKKFKNTGFKKTKSIRQEDRYYDTDNWDLYKNMAALRIRLIEKVPTSFTFKKVYFLHNLSDYYVEERETKFPIDNNDTLNSIFKIIPLSLSEKELKFGPKSINNFLHDNGYYNNQTIFKKRSIYRKKENILTIDEVEKVGTIIELECKKDNPKDIITSILEDHEWKRDHEGLSFKWLRKVKGLRCHLDFFDKAKKNLSWNVRKHEKLFYEEILSRSKT
jgi:adenylate cyclase class IV